MTVLAGEANLMDHDPISITHNRDARILVVDDQEANRELLKRFLSGYRVVAVPDVETALEVMSHSSFDLILLDVMMPSISGFEFLRYLRQQPHFADLPVILVSALDESREIANGLEMGANDYITRPIDVPVFMARIRTQLTLKRMNDERKHTIARLQELEDIRQQLFRIAVHDLRNPLQNIRMAEQLLRENHNDDNTRRILDSMTQTTRTMQYVIENFVDVADLQFNQPELKIETIYTRDVIMDVLTQYEIAAEQKGMYWDYTEIDEYACADYARVVQVLGNLVSNAIKYSPFHSTIRLRAEDRGDYVRISIEDEGPGVPIMERSRLFNEFGRTSNQPTGGENSTGLGLWIVKHLIERMGGRVGVDFLPVRGSIFWVELIKAESMHS